MIEGLPLSEHRFAHEADSSPEMHKIFKIQPFSIACQKHDSQE
jgi:hypothetical protein